eukprot:TRINITY_DN8665_c1_g1_i1.p1 TRINITY_DN8665_c1_g1~~TRINITY_DN8665_c1_g1_i1.p1  ORF type:complete len:1279 (-),score=245.37 TRINITY_DN8665_c1_g1_i1:64-3900(-)
MMIPGLDSYGAGGGLARLRMALPTANELLKGGIHHGASGGAAFPHQSPRFIFRPRTGRINWRLLHSLDLDRVIREGDVETIQAHMENLTYARFSREDLEMTSDDNIMKVMQLAQLCMEFLDSMCGSSQQLLHGLTEKVRLQAAQLKAAQAKQRQSSRHRESHSHSRRRSRSRDKELDYAEKKKTSSALIGVQPRKCPYCPKRFQTEQYLHEHILRRHEKEMFGGGSDPFEEPARRHSPSPAVQASPRPAVHQAAPAPTTATMPPAADQRDELAASLRSVLRDQMDTVQKELQEAMSLMKSQVGRVAEDVTKVAGDVGKLQASPQPVASVMAVEQGPRAAADDKLLEKLNSAMEQKMKLLLDANQKDLLSRIDEVAAAVPARKFEAGATESGTPAAVIEEAAAVAKSAMDAQMKQQMAQLKQMQEEVIKEAGNAASVVAERLREVAAKATADVSAAAEAVARKQPGSNAPERPAPAGPPPSPPVQPQQPAVTQPPVAEPKATSTSEPAKKPSKEVPAKPVAPPTPAAAELAQPVKAEPAQEQKTETKKEDTEAKKEDEPVSGSKAAGLTAAGVSGAVADEIVADLLAAGHIKPGEEAKVKEQLTCARPEGVSESFSKVWEEGMSELKSEDEKAMFAVAMMQERTRPRKGPDGEAGLPEEFEKTWKGKLSGDDAKLAEKLIKAPATKSKKKPFTCCGGSSKASKPAADSKDKSKEKPPPVVHKSKVELTERALAGGLADFFARCGRDPPPAAASSAAPAPPAATSGEPAAPAPSPAIPDVDSSIASSGAGGLGVRGGNAPGGGRGMSRDKSSSEDSFATGFAMQKPQGSSSAGPPAAGSASNPSAAAAAAAAAPSDTARPSSPSAPANPSVSAPPGPQTAPPPRVTQDAVAAPSAPAPPAPPAASTSAQRVETQSATSATASVSSPPAPPKPGPAFPAGPAVPAGPSAPTGPAAPAPPAAPAAPAPAAPSAPAAPAAPVAAPVVTQPTAPAPGPPPGAGLGSFLNSAPPTAQTAKPANKLSIDDLTDDEDTPAIEEGHPPSSAWGGGMAQTPVMKRPAVHDVTQDSNSILNQSVQQFGNAPGGGRGGAAMTSVSSISGPSPSPIPGQGPAPSPGDPVSIVENIWGKISDVSSENLEPPKGPQAANDIQETSIRGFDQLESFNDMSNDLSQSMIRPAPVQGFASPAAPRPQAPTQQRDKPADLSISSLSERPAPPVGISGWGSAPVQRSIPLAPAEASPAGGEDTGIKPFSPMSVSSMDDSRPAIRNRFDSSEMIMEELSA